MKKRLMDNLSKLKGTQDIFSYISITDDYTTTEAELIKKKVKEEKVKSDLSRHYRVRGTPKNFIIQNKAPTITKN